MTLLILESPLLILLSLTQQIGLDIAILQQQLHFRMTHQGHERDGMLWYCQTYTNWMKQLPFWNESKSKRLFIKLEKERLVKINGQVKHVFLSIVQNGIQIEYSVLNSLFYAHPNEKETTTVHHITLPPSTGERSEGAQVVRSKRKDFKDVQKKKKRKVRLSAPLPL